MPKKKPEVPRPVKGLEELTDEEWQRFSALVEAEIDKDLDTLYDLLVRLLNQAVENKDG